MLEGMKCSLSVGADPPRAPMDRGSGNDINAVVVRLRSGSMVRETGAHDQRTDRDRGAT